jgi:hypothetical protein
MKASKNFIWLYILIFLVSCQEHDRGFVVSKVKSVAKLATTEFSINKTILATKDKKLLKIIPLNSAVFVAYTQATIKAGIDINKLKKENIEIDGNSISIKLPAIEVINFSYPFDKYKIDNSLTENEFLNEISIEEQESLYRQSEMEIRSFLKQIGVVEHTEENTRQLIENLLTRLGYTEIYIEFEKSDNLFPNIDLTH